MKLNWSRWPWTSEPNLQIVADANLTAENSRLKREVSLHQSRADKATAEAEALKLKEERQKSLIDISIGDPAPIDTEKRKMYVAAVAGFHKDYLLPKLQQMISRIHTSLEDSENPRGIDQAWKGAAYAFRELILWGDSMVNEQIANQMGQNPAKAEEKLE